MLKFLTKILLAAAVFVFAATSVFATAQPVYGELGSLGANVYNGARGYYGGRSFNGYCGTYVKCQLLALGIFSGTADAHGNGNRWYNAFDNISETSGGYRVYRESGANCLSELARKYGNDLSNIVLSFPIQANYSAQNPGAGHAMVILKLKDGVAYYTESFSYGGIPEGQMVCEDADELIARYSRRHGEPIGCVCLSKTDLEQQSQNSKAISAIAYAAAEVADISQSYFLV